MSFQFCSLSRRVFQFSVLFVTLLSCSGQAFSALPHEYTGHLYVSMWNSNEIGVFTPEGASVERFSTDGLDGPRGIAFNPDNGEVWVAAERSDAIFIFDRGHNFLRKLEHPDFNEPVGVTFVSASSAASSADSTANEVYISNSNTNEIMVFDQSGTLLRRLTHASLNDPNCTAVLADGRLLATNRLGSTTGVAGAVALFDTAGDFQYDFTTAGISSLMAVARDPNGGQGETVWATSGGGDTGIYEFDIAGNLQRSLLPADIGDGRAVVPQGLAFDSSGDFYVVSMLNEVLKFDGDGNLLNRFPTGAGTARSTAFQACTQAFVDGVCVTPGSETASLTTPEATTSESAGSSSGGGKLDLITIAFLLALFLIWRCNPVTRSSPVNIR